MQDFVSTIFGMEHYQRPREKLRYQGVSSLSTVELLQVVIGSGNKKVSASRIARKVEPIIMSYAPNYDELIAIDGVGNAKACQIMAVRELTSRITGDE